MKIPFKQIGRNLVAEINGKKLTITDSTENLAPIKEKINEYNALLNHSTRPAKELLKKIEVAFTPKTEEKKVKIQKEKEKELKEKKVAKHKIKETERAIKETKKTSPKAEKEMSAYEKIKHLLSTEKLSKAQLLEIQKKINIQEPQPKASVSPSRRNGEY